jgi:MFS family permease
MSMGYLGELRRNIRPLLACSIALGTGLPLFATTNSLFGPFLVEEFHWPRSQFALIGLTLFSTLLVLPFIGRFTDRFGVKRVAILGTILIPLCFVAYSLQTGNFYYFMACSTAVLAAGSLTSPLVYTRLIAERFEKAQGLALTIVTTAPALLGAIIAKPLTTFIEVFGWRAGYLAIGAFVLVANVVAVLLIPRDAPSGRDAVKSKYARRPAMVDFGIIVRSPVFWIIIVAFVLCLLPTPLHASQMNMMLLDRGLNKGTAATMVSFFLIGTIVGRLGCGLALDRYPTHLVAAISMGVPALGYLVLATSYGAALPIGIAMFAIGLSYGAENDLTSFLVARYFRIEIFSSTLSLVFAATFFTSASAALIISGILRYTDSFVPFLYLVAGSVIAGALLFLALPRGGRHVKIGEEQLAAELIAGEPIRSV